jgi:hypothetical protein
MTAAEAMEAHRATSDERSQVVTALCSAFFDDRIYRWVVPDDAQRRRSTAIFYSRFVDACWPHGGVYAAGAGAGAALEPARRCGFRRASSWLPTNRPRPSVVNSWRAPETTPPLREWRNLPIGRRQPPGGRLLVLGIHGCRPVSSGLRYRHPVAGGGAHSG